MAVEAVLPGRFGQEGARPPRGPDLRRHVRGQGRGGGIAPPGRPQRLAHLAVREVRRGEGAAPARLVEEVRGRDGDDVLREAEAHVGRVVPQQPPASAAEEHRHHDLAVVLPEVQVASPQVEQPVLVLAEAVEALVLGRLEMLAHLPGRLALARRGLERLAARDRLGQKRAAGGVGERYPS